MNSNPVPLFSRTLGDEGAPALIILHGLLGTSDNWQSLGKQFASTHRVHLVDQRNHGRSPHSEVHDYPVMAGDLERYLDEQGIQRASIIGHSMGGKTTLMFGHHHPDRVEKLVIADMAARAYQPHHGPIFDALLSAPIANAAGRNIIETHLMNRLKDAGVVGFLMKNLRREKSGGYTWRPNLPVLANTLSEVIAGVPLAMNTLPTLAIYGGQSNYVESDDLEQFQEACMQFQSHEIEEAGHWLHASHPDEFYEEVDAFLNG
jgi:pimeloyl-ACP methyl ester carboxylesterase